MLAYIVVIVAIVSCDTKLGKFPTAKTPASRRSKWKDWQTTLYTLRGL